MNLEQVQREDWIVGGLALLLAIFLLILPWFDLSVGPFSATFSATSAPDGWLGVLAFIAAIAIVVDLAIERLSPQTQVPMLNSRAHTRFILAIAVAAFVVLKFLFHIHFSLFGWGFYVDVIVTAALVFFALQVRNGAALPGTPSRRGTGAPPTAGPGSVPPSDPPAGGSSPPPGV